MSIGQPDLGLNYLIAESTGSLTPNLTFSLPASVPAAVGVVPGEVPVDSLLGTYFDKFPFILYIDVNNEGAAGSTEIVHVGFSQNASNWGAGYAGGTLVPPATTFRVETRNTRYINVQTVGGHKSPPPTPDFVPNSPFPVPADPRSVVIRNYGAASVDVSYVIWLVV